MPSGRGGPTNGIWIKKQERKIQGRYSMITLTKLMIISQTHPPITPPPQPPHKQADFEVKERDPFPNIRKWTGTFNKQIKNEPRIPTQLRPPGVEEEVEQEGLEGYPWEIPGAPLP